MQKTHNVLPPNDLHKNISSKIKSETELIDAFDKLSETNQFGLRLNDWLSSIDASLSEQTVLLFDGLDVGFGSSESDRDRRNEAISGLFVHVICRL